MYVVFHSGSSFNYLSLITFLPNSEWQVIIVSGPQDIEGFPARKLECHLSIEIKYLEKLQLKRKQIQLRGGDQLPEVQKIFFFLSSRYNCAIFSAAFKKS